MKISPRLAAPLINGLYRVWCSTLRITETNRQKVDVLEALRKPMVFSLWHDELFPLLHVRVWRTLRIVAVVSQNRDGEYLARLLHSFGLSTARGSSTRGGVSALLHASRLMREQHYNGCLTVDGPRGPRHVVKKGVIFLATRTPAYIVPIRLFFSKAKKFKSWDRFQLPLPFSKVHIIFGDPYLPQIEKKFTGDKEMEEERLRLEHVLNFLHPLNATLPLEQDVEKKTGAV